MQDPTALMSIKIAKESEKFRLIIYLGRRTDVPSVYAYGLSVEDYMCKEELSKICTLRQFVKRVEKIAILADSLR